jgi:hypothetical protein
MKKIIICSFLTLILINILANFIFQNYQNFNMFLVSGSLISSCLLLLFLSINRKINYAYKIGLSFFYSSMLLVRLIIALLSPPKFENNYYFIALLIIISFEMMFLFIVTYMKKHT